MYYRLVAVLIFLANQVLFGTLYGATVPTAPEAKEALPAAIKDHLETIKSGAEPAKVEALKKLGAQELKSVPEEVSKRLYNAAVLDDNAAVRESAAQAIKSLDDKQAMTYLYHSTLHPKFPAAFRVRAAEALRSIDNPEIVRAYIFIVTYEMRFGMAREASTPQQIFLTNGGDINNPLGNINLPIELPDLELTSVHTAFATYATSALSTISRQNFGMRPAAWKQWFEEYEHIRKVRQQTASDYENAE